LARVKSLPAAALYISVATLSTAGSGEIVAASALLRLVSTLQAVTDFGLLTATVSWILQTYPALKPSPAPANQLNLFREAAGPDGGGPNRMSAYPKFGIPDGAESA
jgi:Ion channel